jgi:hypothetical protein
MFKVGGALKTYLRWSLVFALADALEVQQVTLTQYVPGVVIETLK